MPTETAPIFAAKTTENVREAIKYVLAPVDGDEIKLLCIIVCTTLGTALTYANPNIIPVTFVTLLTIFLCLFISAFVWMWAVLPQYKRSQCIERIFDLFRRAWTDYHSTPRATDGEQSTQIQDDKIKHTF